MSSTMRTSLLKTVTNKSSPSVSSLSIVRNTINVNPFKFAGITSVEPTRKFGAKSRGARGHGWLQKYRAGEGGRHLQGRYHYRDVEARSGINESIFELGSTHCFLDIEIEGKDEDQSKTSSRVVIELASTALPKTCENFLKLCQDGYYKDTNVYKIEKETGICMGDILGLDGSGGKCHPDISPNGFFENETHVLSHTHKGILTMLAPGVHRNDSRFCITLGDTPQFDGKYVAFGRVKPVDDDDSGMSDLENIISNVFTKKGKPQKNIRITSCGPL